MPSAGGCQQQLASSAYEEGPAVPGCRSPCVPANGIAGRSHCSSWRSSNSCTEPPSYSSCTVRREKEHEWRGNEQGRDPFAEYTGPASHKNWTPSYMKRVVVQPAYLGLLIQLYQYLHPIQKWCWTMLSLLCTPSTKGNYATCRTLPISFSLFLLWLSPSPSPPAFALRSPPAPAPRLPRLEPVEQ